MNRAPNASTVNKAAKDATLQRVRNAKDDIIAIINRRMQRANFYPLEPDVALADAARIGYRIDVTATFNRESDNFVIDALVMSQSDLARYFGRGTSKNLSVTVQIIRPQRELVGDEYQRVQDRERARSEALANPQGATDVEVMYREVINQVIDIRQSIVDTVNAELPEPLGTEAAISLAARQGYDVVISAEYGNTPDENILGALTMINEQIWTILVYNHIADYAVSWNVEMVVPTTGARLYQNFQDGIANCMLEPIITMFKARMANAKSKSEKYRFSSKVNAAIDMERKYRAHGVPQDHIQRIADELGVNIYIDAPIQGEFIRVSCTGRKYADMHFLNTRTNHVDKINEVTLKNTVFVTRAELDAKVESLRKFNQYFEYQRNDKQITYVRTLEGTFRVRGEYADFISEQERKFGLDGGRLCDVQDEELSAFIRSGLRFNTHVDFMDTSKFARITDDEITDGRRDYKEIDMEKAYKNFARSRYYSGGIPIKITEFRKTEKIEGDGYYLITDVVLTGKFKELDAKLGHIYMDNCVYTKPELMFIKDQGATFTVLAGAWGASSEFNFDDETWNEREGSTGPRLYAKWVGKKAARYDTARHFISGPKVFLRHIASCVSGTGIARILEDTGELYVTYEAERSEHLAHVAGYITALTRVQVLDQLMVMEMDKVIRVASDAIYYIDHVFPITGVFREQQELMKTNFAGVHYVGVDEYIGNVEELPPARVYNRVEHHEGPGGSGKTHYNLHDKGLVRVLYAAPTHKLARAKFREIGCRSVVWARLCSPNPDKWYSLAKFYNVIIIDEVSMMKREMQLMILKRYPNCRIIFCGDMCQLPAYSTDGTPVIPFDVYLCNGTVEHNENHRVKCTQLLPLLAKLRANIDVHGYARSIAREFRQISEQDAIAKYVAEDMLLCYSNALKDRFTSLLKEKTPKWYVTDKNAKYCNGDIVIGDKPAAACDLRHAFTVHSVQGETVESKLFVHFETLCDNRLAYTAFSRARKFDQIYVIM